MILFCKSYNIVYTPEDDKKKCQIFDIDKSNIDFTTKTKKSGICIERFIIYNTGDKGKDIAKFKYKSIKTYLFILHP